METFFVSSDMLNSERDDEECDARDDDSSNAVDQKIIKHSLQWIINT